eukprot:1014304-Pelagomonas_calceolata.AAC.3
MEWCILLTADSDTLLTATPAGTQSSIQDWPGRTGMWHVGVPPSGAHQNIVCACRQYEEGLAWSHRHVGAPPLGVSQDYLIASTACHYYGICWRFPVQRV